MKAQIVVRADNLKVQCIAVCKGKTHDFQLFKDSRLAMLKNMKILADSGYQGIAKYHSNSQIPIKSSKNHSLSKTEKQYNHALSKERIYVEHVNRYLKRFRILSGRYRNKRKKFGLRISLIAGIYNFQN